jgi:hypothetical protein
LKFLMHVALVLLHTSWVNLQVSATNAEAALLQQLKAQITLGGGLGYNTTPALPGCGGYDAHGGFFNPPGDCCRNFPGGWTMGESNGFSAVVPEDGAVDGPDWAEQWRRDSAVAGGLDGRMSDGEEQEEETESTEEDLSDGAGLW